MPKYKYTAIDINNKKVRGYFIAADEEDLKKILNNQQYYPLKYRKIPESSQMFTFLEKIKMDDFTMFCRQFAIMLTAGINIDRTVYILKDSIQNKKLKSILEVVYNDLISGQMLSSCFNKYPKTFPLFFRNMVEIGEASGKLDTIFVKLADYYESDYKIRQRVKAALSYPIFMIILSIVALTIISVFVMPIFDDLFMGLGAELPTISKNVIAVSRFIRTYYKELIAGIIVSAVLFKILGTVKTVRRFIDRLKLKAPIYKNVVIATLTSRFASGLTVLLNSGMSVLDSINIIRKLMGNVIIEDELKIVANEISVGKGVGRSLKTINRFPNVLLEMIEVGETSGSLEEVLTRTAGYFEDEVSSSIRKMTAAIAPLLTMFIAIIVVIVLFAIFLPMLDLLTAIENME